MAHEVQILGFSVAWTTAQGAPPVASELWLWNLGVGCIVVTVFQALVNSEGACFQQRLLIEMVVRQEVLHILRALAQKDIYTSDSTSDNPRMLSLDRNAWDLMWPAKRWAHSTKFFPDETNWPLEHCRSLNDGQAMNIYRNPQVLLMQTLAAES